VDDSRASRASLKDLSPSQFSRLSGLLDQSIAMTPEERNAWLLEIERSDPKSAALLRAMFASQDKSEAQGFLETPELLLSGLSSIVEADPGLIGKQFGAYRVLSLLGHGGMGSVWLADRVDGLFTRQVALKLVHPTLVGRVMTERSAREREILASLNHPNIARLIDAGFAEDGQPYLALEYVSGVPLTTYCDDHRLPIRERLELFCQVLSAVQYAHAHLVIHRDLKPSNIMVTGQGHVYLLDFGIAKLLTEGEARETELTQIGGRALTPDYAAPEQIAGAPITTAADVYALGVMLYELLTGERPYKLKRDSRGALEDAILLTDPAPPSRATLTESAASARATTAKKLTLVLKGDLDTIASKALRKSPAERYATANAFGEDIARFLRGDVVLAQRDSVAYRALKLARRYRVAIAAAGVLVLTLAGGLAATSYEAEVASKQRDAALEANLRLVTQTAAARVKDADVPVGLGIILEVLPRRGVKRAYTSEALSVFQEARAADAQVAVITGHTDRVRSVAFSPDGSRVVTGSFDKTAHVWDAGTGQHIVLLSGHADRVISAGFSPDGQRIVTGSYDKTARIWDVTTGREVMRLSGHTDRVRSVAFSPDGRFIATASYDKTARIWNAATGAEIGVLSGHTEVVTSVAYSPDGRYIVTASYDKTARIWDVATRKSIILLSGHTDRMTSAAFSPDGRRIVTASGDKTARIWDVVTGAEIKRMIGHTQLVASAAFSPDGQRVVTAAYDKTARIWDAVTSQQITVLSGHTDMVETAAFSPDGRRVITGSSDTTARIWDAAGREITRLSGHTDSLPSALFSPDGRRVVTSSFDRTARIWDVATGKQTLLLSGHLDRVTWAAFSPDGQRVVTASLDKTARIWDAATGQQIMLLRGHADLVFTAAFSPDGRRVVTASLDTTARVWDAATGRELMQLTGHAAPVEFAAFSPDGRRIVTASNDKTARIWDALTGQQIMVLNGHSDVVEKAAFSPDGRRIITSSDDKTARIWDAATGLEIMLLSGHADQVPSAAFSPDGRRVVTASSDRTARIWDAATGQQLMVLKHADLVEVAAFSPDGRSIVTASDDNIARIWDANTPTLETQIGWAAAAQFEALPRSERFQLGLPAPPDVRQWPVNNSQCDASAAAPYDPDRRAAGLMLDDIVTDIAVGACTNTDSRSDGEARALYQQGRALMANGKFSAAGADFEKAVARNYRAARVELGLLLSRPSAGMLDIRRAISLYEQAWTDGVTIAAFELGNLYEHGVNRSDKNNEYVLAPDETRAWFWYQKAGDAGEPNALARFAARNDGAAFSEQSAANRNSYWLESFKYYTAATDRARSEDWPDDAWRDWRYRRASLARLLAREGMMPEIADAYENVRTRYARPPTVWERLTSPRMNK
jgi:WD40 repeat protein/serine/threonine protein kinase/TPR repeat protein